LGADRCRAGIDHCFNRCCVRPVRIYDTAGDTERSAKHVEFVVVLLIVDVIAEPATAAEPNGHT
jgi:hypothetical protein